MTPRLASARLRPLLAAWLLAGSTFAIAPLAIAQTQTPTPTPPTLQQSRTPAPTRRIPRQQALQAAALDGVVRETISDTASRPIPSAQLTLKNADTNQFFRVTSNAEGIFRLVPIPPGHYELRAEAENYTPLTISDLVLNA